MKQKISTIFIISMLLLTNLLLIHAINVNADQTKNIISNTKDNIVSISSEPEEIEIRVAILTDEIENEEFYSQHGRTRYFMYALKNYSWKVDNTEYRFNVTLLSNEQIINGELTIDNYEVALYPPEAAWEKVFSTGFSNLPKNKKRVENIKEFIEEGGGYFGTCAGGEIVGGMENEPDTFFERMWKNSCLGISALTHEYNMATPILCQWMGYGADAVGTGGYIQYSGWNTSNYDINYYNGVCIDAPVFHNNSIFDDYLEDTRKIRWNAGPAMIIPDDPDREINILANYPAEEISDNESSRIHHWKYNGGFLGLAKAFLKSAFVNDGSHFFSDLGIFMDTFVFAEDWEMMDEIVETNLADQPIMVSEIYPNENEARIVSCAGHPEMNVWWGGHIEETEDTDNNNIFDAFHKWVDVTPRDKNAHNPSTETEYHEFSYNYWLIRRSVAWVSQKVADNDLPPVYESSQVCDITPYEQTTCFTVKGNVEKSNGTESLELYYRHSCDNSSWEDWTLYEIDNDGSDGWNWTFNAPQGSGYYQFYSIRKVDYGGYELNETAPPGPDAIVKVTA